MSPFSDQARYTVRPNAYADSVTLLQVTSSIRSLPGILDAALVMGTDLNIALLIESGLLPAEAAGIGPNDLVIAVKAASGGEMVGALAEADRLLAGRRPADSADATEQPPRSLHSAHRRQPGANLAVISVPGAYAAAEARQALAEGLHVFLFSDNVPLADEVELKQSGREKNLLVMGPDCGTAVINGVGLGFANVVRRGSIGLIGASGTGLQEVSTLLDRAGQGISHAIGTGGRDLYEKVGGITTLQALELLRDDPGTERIVLISKPASKEVAQRVLHAAARVGKPIVACLLGADLDPPAGVEIASNLYQAARLAAPEGRWEVMDLQKLPRLRRQPGQNQIRGLYCGGTLCQEAERAIGSLDVHQLIDFGDDQYTRGRAHPMIDPSLRNAAILAAGDDPHVAVLLLDVILGYGAHDDPASAVVQVVHDAVARAQRSGRELAVLAHVVGTEADPQGLQAQEATLREAGAHLFGSNHHAAVAASLLVDAEH